LQVVHVVQSIWELEQLRTPQEPLIVFHGTRAIFSNAIERRGWTQDTLPVRLADLKMLNQLSQRAEHLVGRDSLAFTLNLRKYTGAAAFLVHLSAKAETALMYAGQKGGETIKNLVARCRELGSGEPGLFTLSERAEIQSILRDIKSTNGRGVA
jgi:hypothetical protein